MLPILFALPPKTAIEAEVVVKMAGVGTSVTSLLLATSLFYSQ